MNAASLTESELLEPLAREGLHPTRWSNSPHGVYATHDHPYGKILVVVSGQITFTLSKTHRVISMNPGDRFELPPHTSHSAVVGPNGVVCLEAHRSCENPSLSQGSEQ